LKLHKKGICFGCLAFELRRFVRQQPNGLFSLSRVVCVETIIVFRILSIESEEQQLSNKVGGVFDVLVV